MIAGKRLYNLLPIWTQTLAVNSVSARKWPEKYGRQFKASFERLKTNEQASLDELVCNQTTAIKELLSYAVRHVPYYRSLHVPVDNLQEWPILEKRTVVNNPEAFLSDAYGSSEVLSLKTSGTTGTPLTVKVSKTYHQMEMAFRWRHKAWGGVEPFSKGAYVAGHPVVPADQTLPPFWRVDRVEKRLLCSSYHLASENLPDYIKAMTTYAPDFIHGYPSSLAVLAGFILERGVTTVRPKAVFTASETLLDFQHAAIEQAFGAKVFNWYGNTEMTCNIIQCGAGSLHYRMDYGVLEILEDGTMVCTGLNNRAMPFIRYKVGDRAAWGKSQCACGSRFPTIERLEGRTEDYVMMPDGRPIGRLDHVFKDRVPVREAQIIQTKPAEITLRIVRDTGYTFQHEQIILAEARQRLGKGMKVRFEYVDRIERLPNGKFRFVVSTLLHRAPMPENLNPGERISPHPFL